MVCLSSRGGNTNRFISAVDDVLRARIQTVGIEEHLLKMETGTINFVRDQLLLLMELVIESEAGQTWAIVDVGGGRQHRGVLYRFRWKYKSHWSRSGLDTVLRGW